MQEACIENKKIEKIDFSEEKLAKEYDHCIFINCNFSNVNLSRIVFIDCDFTGCNLSMAGLTQTALQDVKFKDCKLMGLHFENCKDFLFEVTFDNCVLQLASFYKVKLKKTFFGNSMLHEADFTESDLSNAVFDNCDLAGATFENTILEKADLRSARNYSIHPESNRIKKAKFSTAGIAGLLEAYDIEIE
jgi:fluoroquinolone resistance protein